MIELPEALAYLPKPRPELANICPHPGEVRLRVRTISRRSPEFVTIRACSICGGVYRYKNEWNETAGWHYRSPREGQQPTPQIAKPMGSHYCR